MVEHTVRIFDAELQALRQKVTDMGRITERQFVDAIQALSKRDLDLAQKVKEADDAVDALQLEIETKMVDLTARRQPVAVDLRALVGAMRIAIDLERIGDLSVNIAKRVATLSHERWPNEVTISLRHMAKEVTKQLLHVLDSYIRGDAAQAVTVWQNDEEIDALNTALFRELLTYMMADARSINYATHLIFCAKNIERVGDHATNIAESVYYIAQGHTISGERPKGHIV